MTAQLIRLDRAVVSAHGADAEHLLHDTLTTAVAGLAPGSARWFGLLSPQGKILVEGLILREADRFWFDLPPSAAETFLKRMRLYKLRADVDFLDRTGELAVGWSAEPFDSSLGFADPRSTGLGYRAIVPAGEAADWSADATAFETARIATAVPELGADFGADERFPHDIGMDQLGGVDFQKGCFVGQEVVSRMQHRGTARRRPVRVSGTGVAAGAEVQCAGRSVGSVTSALADSGLAIVRIDRIEDPAACVAGGQPAVVELPEWASYGFSAADDTESD